MMSCERGDMNEGLLALCLPSLKILAILLVFVNNAAYTTVKQSPAATLSVEKKRLHLRFLASTGD